LDLIAVYTADTSGEDGAAYGEAAKHISKLTEAGDNVLARLTGSSSNGNEEAVAQALMEKFVKQVMQSVEGGSSAESVASSVPPARPLPPSAPKTDAPLPKPTPVQPPNPRPRGCFICGALDHLAAQCPHKPGMANRKAEMISKAVGAVLR